MIGLAGVFSLKEGVPVDLDLIKSNLAEDDNRIFAVVEQIADAEVDIVALGGGDPSLEKSTDELLDHQYALLERLCNMRAATLCGATAKLCAWFIETRSSRGTIEMTLDQKLICSVLEDLRKLVNDRASPLQHIYASLDIQ